MKLQFSAGGLVYKKDKNNYKFALILNSYDKWTFPKGHIENKEKPEIAALREVSEEIGLTKLRVIKLLDKIDYWFKEKDELYHKFVYYYLMEATSPSRLSPQISEIKQAEWLGKAEAIKNLGYKEDISLLKKAVFILKI